MPLSGGPSGKAGVRYEDRYTALEALRVLRGAALAITIEPTSTDGEGVEFFVEEYDHRSFHQVKRQRAAGPWTVSALKSEGVLETFSKKLDEPGAKCVFLSQQSVDDLLELTERARSAASGAHFRNHFLTSDKWTQRTELAREAMGNPSDDILHDKLRRIHVRAYTEPELVSSVGDATELEIDLASKSRETFIAELVDRLRESIHQRLTREDLLVMLAERDYRPNPWRAPETLHGALDKANARAISGLRRRLIGGQLIERTELSSVIESLNNNRVTVLAGDAGSGKSAFLLQILDQLRLNNTSYLILRLSDVMDSNALTATKLGRALGLDGSPALVLSRASRSSSCVLILDQLDALSVVSGRTPQVMAAVHEMARTALAEMNVRLVLACRSFDLAHDPQIRDLQQICKDSTSTIKLGELSTEAANEALKRIGIEWTRMSAQQQKALTSPLAIALLAEASDKDPSFSFTSLHDLHGMYWTAKRAAVNEKLHREAQWWEVLFALVDRMSDDQTLSARATVADRWNTDVEAMISCGVLFLECGRLSFFHETFFDYAYARCHVERRRSIQMLLAGDQWLFRRAQVRQVLNHEEQELPKQFINDIRHLVSSSDIRPHIKHLTLTLLPTFQPTAQLWELLRSLLTDPNISALDEAWSTLTSSTWFRWADDQGFFEHIFENRIDWAIDRTCFVLMQNAKQNPERVAALLGRMDATSFRYEQTVRSVAYQAASEHRALYDLFMISMASRDRAPSVADMIDGVARSLEKRRPAWALELFGASLNAWANVAEMLKASDVFEHKRDIVPVLYLEFLPNAASRAPSAFFEFVWPVMLRLCRVTKIEEDGLVHDTLWRSRHLSRHPDTKQTILATAEAAAAALAKSDIAGFRRLASEHADEIFETVIYVLYQGFAAVPDELGAEAAGFLLDDVRRLRVGYSTDPHWGTCRLLRAISAHLDNAMFARLESAIVGYRDPHIRRSRRYDRAEFALLSSLQHSRLSPAAQRRLGEMQRKFERSSAEAPSGVFGGLVRSPIPAERAVRMSDANWSRAVLRHAQSGMQKWKEKVPVGGAGELAPILEDHTKKEPERFVRLALAFSPAVNPTYYDAILRGVAGASSKPKADLVRQLVQKCHDLPDRPCGRWLAYMLERLDAEHLEDSNIDVLAWYATDTRDPAPDSDDSSLDILARGLNSTRGAVADCFAHAVSLQPELMQSRAAVIESLCGSSGIRVARK